MSRPEGALPRSEEGPAVEAPVPELDWLAGRLILESLRLDFESEDSVRVRADAALALGAGGFIVFGGAREQVAALIDDLRRRAARPLWIAADLERGPGQQFAGLPTLPPPAGLAAHPAAEEAARMAGAITARGARELGVNLVFAPVLDLDHSGDNPIIGTRSFGRDPVVVARLAGAWIEGCQAEGVVACAKHFPGHGRTTVDSHDETPVVSAPRADLEADLLPFRRVAGQVGAVMTAHVAYPSLCGRRPATIAPGVLGDLLRDEIGFEGIVVTDALNMGGFAGFADENEATNGDEHSSGTGPVDPAVAALMAGCDLLLYPEDFAATAAAIAEAARRDPAVASRVREALGRGDAVRERIGDGAGHRDPDGAAQDMRDAAVLSMLSIREKGERPDWLHSDRPVRVVAIWDDREVAGRPELGELFAEELENAGWSVAPPGTNAPAIVLIASTPQAWKGTAGLTPAAAAALDGAMAGRAGAYPVVFGHTRILRGIGGPGLCAWGTEAIMERFAARKLTAAEA